MRNFLFFLQFEQYNEGIEDKPQNIEFLELKNFDYNDREKQILHYLMAKKNIKHD